MLRFAPLAVLALASFSSLVLAGDFLTDVETLTVHTSKPIFNEDDIGYDNHADIFYYQDAAVAQEYARSNYLATQITLAGQDVDLTGRSVKRAVYPFAVAQRTFKGFGTFKDRWDVKEFYNRYQYLGLFHGKGNDLVLNKLRAHLLRRLANAVNDFLPRLDRTGDVDVEGYTSVVGRIKDHFRAAVENVYREVDRSIRDSMHALDDSKASATVAIVSENYVITISVGNGTVVAYDSDFAKRKLVDLSKAGDDGNLFGARKSRPLFSLQPIVDFHLRFEPAIQFLLLETPSVAANVDVNTAFKAVLSSVGQHKKNTAQEQELYSSAVTKVLEKVSTSLSAFHRFFLHSDYSVILVGLETNYKMIH